MEYQSWEWHYIHEIRPDKRRMILAEKIQEEGMSPANELRQKLLQGRYGQSRKNGDTEIDYFIRGMMNLSMLRASSGLMARRRMKKEIAGIMDDWKLKYVEEYGSIGEMVIYQELCNTVLRYINMCRSDSNYSGLILGMGRMSNRNLENKIMKELYTLAYEIPKKAEVWEQMEIFSRATIDMYCEEYPSKADEMRQLTSRA